MDAATTLSNVRNAAENVVSPEALNTLYEEISQSKLAGQPEHMIHSAVLKAVTNHRDLLRMMDGEESPLTLQHVEAAYDRMAAGLAEKSSKVKNATHATKTVVEALKLENRITDRIKVKKPFLEHLGMGEKVNLGLWLVASATSAFGAWSSAQHIVDKDEQGKNHFHPTMLGITMLEGVFAAGTAYLSYNAIKGAAR